MPSPGGRPARAVNACTAGIAPARIAVPIAVPSSSRALTLSRPAAGRQFERLEAVDAAEDDEVVSRANRRLGLGVEFHASVGAADADDDDAEALTQPGVEQALAGQRRSI